jgi:opacity protein-like surface antigen
VCKTLFFIIIIAALVISPQTGLCGMLFDGVVNLNIASPVGEYKDKVDKTGFGISGAGLFKIGLLPVKCGLEVGYVSYGDETTKIPAGLGESINLTTSNKNVSGHVLLRIQQGLAGVAPYVDVLAGVTSFTSDTSLKTKSNVVSAFKSTDFKDTKFSYGVGAGVMIKMAQIVPIAGPSMHLNLGLRYLNSGKSGFLKDGSVAVENGDITFDRTRVKSGLMQYNVGLAFTF